MGPGPSPEDLRAQIELLRQIIVRAEADGAHLILVAAQDVLREYEHRLAQLEHGAG
jgi:hypothetical protein